MVRSVKKFLLSGLMIVALLQVANTSASARKRTAPTGIDPSIHRLVEDSIPSDLTKRATAEKAITQLISGNWCTNQLAADIADSHYISDKEMKRSLAPGDHKVRIIVGRGDKTAQVKINLESILAAVKADQGKAFQGCQILPAPHSGEVDFRFGQAGLAVLEEVSIAIYQKTHWEDADSLQIVGVRMAAGETSLAHFYPLVE